MDSLRVSELAKELKMTSKDLIDKFAEISINVKSHSNTVTPEQIRKVKEHLGVVPKKNTAKKAFIVKKAKTPSQEPEVVVTDAKEAPKVERVERVERVQRVEKAPKIEVVEKAPAREDAVVKKAEKPSVRIERTKIEYPKNQSRIEIVRKAPVRQPEGEKREGKSEDRGDRKPFNKQAGDKKLVERRIIPQEIYEGKGQSKKKADHKSKDRKDFRDKKEDQEMISLEKAAAQKHKKRTQAVAEKEAVTSIVVNQPMTIQELADKIQKTPAEIVRFFVDFDENDDAQKLILDVIRQDLEDIREKHKWTKNKLKEFKEKNNGK